MGGREPAKRLIEAYYGSRKGSGTGSYKGCTAYSDYRELLEKEKDLDAVYVATPDHWHAPISLAAMKRHKHVLCQKPMTHTIGDARRMAQMAREMKVATSLPVNNPSSEPTRLITEWLADGAIGARARSPQLVQPPILAAGHRPAAGSADRFPKASIGISGWVRRRSVRSIMPICRSSGAAGTISAAARSAIWAATVSPAFSRSWGSRRPLAWKRAPASPMTRASRRLPSCTWIIQQRAIVPPCACRGTTAVCGPQRPAGLRAEDQHLLPSRRGQRRHPVRGRQRHHRWPGSTETIRASIRNRRSISRRRAQPRGERPRDVAIDQWVAACKGGAPAPLANFEIQSPVTEAFLLGCIAQRFPGERIEWDTANMRITSSEKLNGYVDPAGRDLPAVAAG